MPGRAILRPSSLYRERPWPTKRALLRSLPKADSDFGTVEFRAGMGSWNTTNVTVPECSEEDFIVIGWGCDTLAYLFPLGLNVSLVTTLGMMQNGSVGSGALGLLRREVDGTAWTASLALNTGGSTWRYSAGIQFRAGPGFRGEQTSFVRYDGGSSGSFAMAPTANPGPPGGVCVAFANEDTGGAGPNSSVSGAGWVFGATSGGTAVIAYYILPMDRVLTPPTATFSSSRADFWMGGISYLR